MSPTVDHVPTDAPRFEFGANWRRFARDLTPEGVDAARSALADWLGESLEGKTFLDVGSGSGLSSLAATLLGAQRVHSLDYDPDSVETTAALRNRLAPGSSWTVERGDVLDAEYMSSLGKWDVVYSWGVLHHTGALWAALDAACDRVSPGGRLFIAIYNDQGWMSGVWKMVKRIYNLLPRSLRVPFAVLVMLPAETRTFLGAALRLRPRSYLRLWRGGGDYERGMEYWHDLLDWAGGYPFEVASPEQVFDFCAARGFELRKLATVAGSHGCNQFLVARPAPADGR